MKFDRIKIFIRQNSIGLKVLCVMTIILIPAVHLGIFYRFWVKKPREIDGDKCTCDCWDAYFKGTYELGDIKYKHVYFNSNKHTFLIWLVSMAFFLFVYESIKRLLELFVSGKLRLNMSLVFLSSFYAHYYSWWMYFNAINDQFYDQIVHQTIFTLTELISTCAALKNSNSDNPIDPRHVALMFMISLFHIAIALKDQFIVNVLLGMGSGFQIFRDLGLTLGDVITSAITIRALIGCKIDSLAKFGALYTKNELSAIMATCFVLGLASFLF